MFSFKIQVALVYLLLCFAPAFAQDAVVVGGDTYVSGSNASLDTVAGRDAYLSGFSVDVSQRVEKDIGATGFDIDVSAPVGGDAYLGGFSIEVDQTVGEDLTAAGFNIQTKKGAAVAGNARFAAGTLAIDGPVAGSLVATAGSLALNASIAGDARVVVGSMTFGPDAKIAGRLTYSSTKPIAIPASVIDPARVTFEQLNVSEEIEKARDTVNDTVPVFWWTMGGAIFVFAVSIAFLVALSAALLSFMPDRMESLRTEAIRAPVKTASLGILGLSMSIGLVPVSAMTLIGIPLIPFAMLLSLVLWIVGYIIGTFALSTRILEAFRSEPLSLAVKLLALAFGFTVLAILNFVPIVGWLINLGVVFLGLGSMILRAARNLTRDEVSSVNVAPLAATSVVAPAQKAKPSRK